MLQIPTELIFTTLLLHIFLSVLSVNFILLFYRVVLTFCLSCPIFQPFRQLNATPLDNGCRVERYLSKIKSQVIILSRKEKVSDHIP